MKGKSLPLFGPQSPTLSHQEAGLDDLSVFQILWSNTPSPTPGCPQAGLMVLKGRFSGRKKGAGKDGFSPQGEVRVGCKGYRWAGRQARCQGNKEDRVARAGKRTLGPRLPNL